MNEEETLAFANDLLDWRLPVIVCKPRGDSDDVVPIVSWKGITGTDEDLARCREMLSRFAFGTDALALIGGHGVDLIDVDTKAGGSVDPLLPFRNYGITRTPSGGAHYVVPSTGLRKIQGLTVGGQAVGDYIGGTAEHGSRMLAFLPGSARPKYGAVLYEVEEPWDVEGALLMGPEAALVARLRAAGGDDSEAEPVYIDASPERDPSLGVHPYAKAAIAAELARLDALPTPWAPGSYWDDTTFEVACALLRFANSGWTGYVEDDALSDLLGHAPSDGQWGEREHRAKWRSAKEAVGGAGRQSPNDPARDFTPDASAGADAWPPVPSRLDDAHLAAWMAHRGLGGLWCWAGGLGWLQWDGRRWVPRAEENVREAVRLAVIEVNRASLSAGAGATQMKALAGLLNAGRIGALASLMKGVVAVDAAEFDGRPDLLNVGNGVVDLRTGDLLPHHRALRLTKITETPYVPGATHPDWEQVLTALEPEVMDWLQVRFGQGATGHPPDDDLLPIGQGNGANGKSTLLGGLFRALGEHMVLVPEKLLRASPNDHPTELTTLRGARVAVVEETPEVADLNVPRLKAMLGTEFITARQIRRDNVTWRATHSLFLMTNYRPRVNETDHGTWRRLALVRFGKTFPRDSRFRARVARGDGGRREAALAWVVEGARQWYAAGQAMPEQPGRVEADTAVWRAESDLVLGYVAERLEPEPRCHVPTSEVLNDLNVWLEGRGHKRWSSQLLTSRFEGHGIAKVRPSRAVQVSTLADPVRGHDVEFPAKPWLFAGYRFREGRMLDGLPYLVKKPRP